MMDLSQAWSSQKNKRGLSPEQKAYVQAHYATMTKREIAAHLGVCEKQVYNYGKRQNLKTEKHVKVEAARKQAEQAHPNAIATRFQKGIIPHNKGKKMPQWVVEKTAATQFRKGNEPHNTLYDGATSIRKDNRGVPYRFIRVKKGVWITYKNYIWEQHHGPIPPKHKIVFINGDTLDERIENLACISFADMMKRNAIHNYPKPIKELLQVKKGFTRRLNKIKKQYAKENNS